MSSLPKASTVEATSASQTPSFVRSPPKTAVGPVELRGRLRARASSSRSAIITLAPCSASSARRGAADSPRRPGHECSLAVQHLHPPILLRGARLTGVRLPDTQRFGDSPACKRAHATADEAVVERVALVRVEARGASPPPSSPTASSQASSTLRPVAVSCAGQDAPVVRVLVALDQPLASRAPRSPRSSTAGSCRNGARAARSRGRRGGRARSASCTGAWSARTGARAR